MGMREPRGPGGAGGHRGAAARHQPWAARSYDRNASLFRLEPAQGPFLASVWSQAGPCPADGLGGSGICAADGGTPGTQVTGWRRACPPPSRGEHGQGPGSYCGARAGWGTGACSAARSVTLGDLQGLLGLPRAAGGVRPPCPPGRAPQGQPDCCSGATVSGGRGHVCGDTPAPLPMPTQLLSPLCVLGTGCGDAGCW